MVNTKCLGATNNLMRLLVTHACVNTFKLEPILETQIFGLLISELKLESKLALKTSFESIEQQTVIQLELVNWSANVLFDFLHQLS